MAITDPRAISSQHRSAKVTPFIDTVSMQWVDFGSYADGSPNASFFFSEREGTFLVEFAGATHTGGFMFTAELGSAPSLILLSSYGEVDTTLLDGGAKVLAADNTLVETDGSFAPTATKVAPVIEENNLEIGMVNDTGEALNFRIMRIG